jgi:hypothetical protein
MFSSAAAFLDLSVCFNLLPLKRTVVTNDAIARGMTAA